MATSLPQTKVARVFRRTPNDQVQQENSDGLTFWEKELLENQRRRQTTTEVETSAKNESENRGAAVNGETSIQEQQLLRPQPASSTLTEHVASTDNNTEPGTILYHPGGLRAGGIPATKLDIDIDDEDYDSDSEPVSTSHELVGRFCIFSHVIKFPYKYMEDPDSRVSRRFFSSEKAFQRNWDMHYLFGPDSYSHKPLMLVPLAQVQKLIQEIGQEFRIDVDVPEYPFQVSFYDDGTPSPTRIGLVNSKANMADAQSKIPTVPKNYGRLSTNPTKSQVRDHDAWTKKVERVYEAEKKKKSSKKKRRREKRGWVISEDAGLLQRAQRYLGLRAKPNTTEAIQPDSPSDAHQLIVTQDGGSTADTPDLSQLAPFPFEDNVVIICVDVEAWEMDHSAITEIGVSTLDTADIKTIAPGVQGEQWIKKIRSRHLRIKGRESLYNFKFCKSNPDMFEFGTSEFATLEEAAEVVNSCFEHPYSAGFECERRPQADEKGPHFPRASTSHDTEDGSNPDVPRALLFVGHDVVNDIDYLSSLGGSVFNSATKSEPISDGSISRRQRILSSIREQIDTAVFYKMLSKDEQSRSLAKVCAELDVMAWYPHNAGNDARYTLEAFVKMVIKSRLVDDGMTAITKNVGDLKIEKETPLEAIVQTRMKDIVNGTSAKETTQTIGGQVSDHYAPFCGPEAEYIDVVPDRRHPDPEDEISDDDGSSDEAPY